MNTTDEFENSFLARFGSTGLRTPDHSTELADRIKTDRRAGMARSQRKRKDLRDETFNMRCSRSFHLAADLLSKHHDISKADAVHNAVFEALKAYKLTLPEGN